MATAILARSRIVSAEETFVVLIDRAGTEDYFVVVIVEITGCTRSGKGCVCISIFRIGESRVVRVLGEYASETEIDTGAGQGCAWADYFGR